MGIEREPGGVAFKRDEVQAEFDGDVFHPDDLGVAEEVSWDELVAAAHQQYEDEQTDALVDAAVEYESHSPAYHELNARLDEAFANSTASGYGELKIKLGDHDYTGVTRFVATEVSHMLSDKMMSKEDYLLLVAKAADLSEQFELSRSRKGGSSRAEAAERGCDCSCQICENGGGLHCHNERTNCFI